MQPGSGGVPTRQRGFPKCPAVLGWVAAGQNGFLQFAEEPKNTSKENGRGMIRVIKARNIADDGSLVSIHDYDTWIEEKTVRGLAIARYIGDETVYLSPNMTYNPRVIRNSGDFVPDGSVAVLIPKQKMHLTAEQMAWFSSDEYRRFYAIARNFSTQSINIDKTSVFFFGVPSHD